MVRIGGEPFNMTVAGLRLSRIASAVAELSRSDFQQNVAGRIRQGADISITNGVHPGTWRDKAVLEAYEDPRGKLWDAHMEAKSLLLSEIYARCGVTLDPNKIFIGFARRLRHINVVNDIPQAGCLFDILRTGEIQLVFSGKAHPLDDAARTSWQTSWKWMDAIQRA